MPRAAIENNRMSRRIRPTDKQTIMGASALENTDMTDFIVRTAVQAPQKVIARAEQVELSERDSLHVLEVLENSPAPNAKLKAAAQAMPPRP